MVQITALQRSCVTLCGIFLGHPVLANCCKLFVSCYLKLVSCYLLLASCYISFAICFLVLGTWYLVLATCFLLLGSCYLLLVTLLLVHFFLILATCYLQLIFYFSGMVGGRLGDPYIWNWAWQIHETVVTHTLVLLYLKRTSWSHG